MIKKNKVLASVLATLMSLSTIGGLSANAASKYEYESGNVFVDAWEKTKSYDNGNEKLKYGYDTWCQKEDYCKSYVKNTAQTAKVTAGSLSETASGSAGSWSWKADVAHQSGTIYWYVMW